ncbi:hypothetical protein PLEOSDRAFT_163900 [Pleurotus ostreatus PC15]|uniref:Lectin n=1 Tax=Pleurotus ostreatus (strain PC15) TaxID=1137138 RepID=A0A067P241_PLEO1|nr:hypothetical protein PLEOSDRAFT_163900 [Pleurotus ostreatus PC15]
MIIAGKSTAVAFTFFAALIVAAAPDRQLCGDAENIADKIPSCKVTAPPGPFQPPSFNVSKWIWTGENPVPGGVNPVGVRAFRKNIVTPCGKCAVHATIIVASDNTHVFYVNGVEIGAGAGWTKGQVLYATLRPSSNLFAIAGGNIPPGGPAGVIASILIHYADGSTETFITDETWRTVASAAPPKDFQLPATDDSKWGFAALQGIYAKTRWGAVALPPVLGFNDSKWIWSSDHKNGAAPKGVRAFRKTVNECAKVAVSATVLIIVDDSYTLYVNGEKVGAGNSYTRSQAWTILNLHPTFNTFAISAGNIGGPAGVLATILITYNDGSNQTVVTDGSWKAIQTVPKGFELPFVNEAEWEDAKVVGPFGVGPWGKGVVIPLA